MATPAPANFDYAQMRRIVGDLFVHRPWIYWTDMIVSMTIGYTASYGYLDYPIGSWQQVACFFIAGFAFYRLGTFMHEIVHMRHDEMRWFRFVWNISNGVQLVTPSHFYESHLDHHNTGAYGTGRDGEYLPLGRGIFAHLFNYLITALMLPALVIFRFMVITPLALVFPGLRRWAWQHWSSFVMNFGYRRSLPKEPQHWMWTALEVWCSVRCWMVIVLVLQGDAPWRRLPLVYLMASFIMGINLVRTFVAHRWHGSGAAMSHRDQILDTNTIVGDWFFTELLCPLGMRYHALHHLFPALPYHNLGIAHRRLMRELPADAAYRQTVYSGFWTALAASLRDAWQEGRSGGENSAEWYARRKELLGEEPETVLEDASA
jgi:fatty acid desaturase